MTSLHCPHCRQVQSKMYCIPTGLVVSRGTSCNYIRTSPEQVYNPLQQCHISRNLEMHFVSHRKWAALLWDMWHFVRRVRISQGDLTSPIGDECMVSQARMRLPRRIPHLPQEMRMRPWFSGYVTLVIRGVTLQFIDFILKGTFEHIFEEQKFFTLLYWNYKNILKHYRDVPRHSYQRKVTGMQFLGAEGTLRPTIDMLLKHKEIHKNTN
jgi:hypothetical protein